MSIPKITKSLFKKTKQDLKKDIEGLRKMSEERGYDFQQVMDLYGRFLNHLEFSGWDLSEIRMSTSKKKEILDNPHPPDCGRSFMKPKKNLTEKQRPLPYLPPCRFTENLAQSRFL